MIDKKQMYSRLTTDLSAVFEGEGDLIANMANCAALLYRTLPDLNWAGFYRTIGNDLVLGPFQGLPACVRICFRSRRLWRGSVAKADDRRSRRASFSGTHRL